MDSQQWYRPRQQRRESLPSLNQPMNTAIPRQQRRESIPSGSTQPIHTSIPKMNEQSEPIHEKVNYIDSKVPFNFKITELSKIITASDLLQHFTKFIKPHIIQSIHIVDSQTSQMNSAYLVILPSEQQEEYDIKHWWMLEGAKCFLKRNVFRITPFYKKLSQMPSCINEEVNRLDNKRVFPKLSPIKWEVGVNLGNGYYFPYELNINPQLTMSLFPIFSLEKWRLLLDSEDKNYKLEFPFEHVIDMRFEQNGTQLFLCCELSKPPAIYETIIKPIEIFDGLHSFKKVLGKRSQRVCKAISLLKKEGYQLIEGDIVDDLILGCHLVYRFGFEKGELSRELLERYIEKFSFPYKFQTFEFQSADSLQEKEVIKEEFNVYKEILKRLPEARKEVKELNHKPLPLSGYPFNLHLRNLSFDTIYWLKVLISHNIIGTYYDLTFDLLRWLECMESEWLSLVHLKKRDLKMENTLMISVFEFIWELAQSKPLHKQNLLFYICQSFMSFYELPSDPLVLLTREGVQTCLSEYFGRIFVKIGNHKRNQVRPKHCYWVTKVHVTPTRLLFMPPTVLFYY